MYWGTNRPHRGPSGHRAPSERLPGQRGRPGHLEGHARRLWRPGAGPPRIPGPRLGGAGRPQPARLRRVLDPQPDQPAGGRRTATCWRPASCSPTRTTGTLTRRGWRACPSRRPRVVRTARRCHYYWRVTDLPVESFRARQKDIAETLGTDPAVCNPARFLRVPGFAHWKTGRPIPVTLEQTADSVWHAPRPLRASKTVQRGSDHVLGDNPPTASTVAAARAYVGAIPCEGNNTYGSSLRGGGRSSPPRPSGSEPMTRTKPAGSGSSVPP
jgi:hypothetical protein